MEFDTEYKKYRDDVYRLAYSYALNVQDAEDILQKTFLQLYKNMHKFSDSDSLKHWLVVVTINQCKNNLTSFWKSRVIHPELIENIDAQRGMNNMVYSEFSKLKKNYRIPLYLNIMYGYTSKEIADIMNITESSVKMRLKRAKDILRLEWEEK